MKVEQFYNKNQFLINGKDGLYFQSYNSMIAKITNDGVLQLGYDWDYSRTTMKHLYLFLIDYRYELNQDYFEDITKVLESSNKRKALQKLIDSQVIEVKEEL